MISRTDIDLKKWRKKMNKESMRQIRAFLVSIEEEKQKKIKSKENIRTLIAGFEEIVESADRGVEELESGIRELKDGVDSLSEYM